MLTNIVVVMLGSMSVNNPLTVSFPLQKAGPSLTLFYSGNICLLDARLSSRLSQIDYNVIQYIHASHD